MELIETFCWRMNRMKEFWIAFWEFDNFNWILHRNDRAWVKSRKDIFVSLTGRERKV